MSNRERIARAAEEARLAAAERAAKTPAKKSAKKTGGSNRPEPSVRMKVIWEVCNPSGKPVKSFAYPDKAQAEAEVLARTKSTGVSHVLRPTKVPMDE